MLQSTSSGAEALSALEWSKVLAGYRIPRLRRSLLEIAVTVFPFLVLWLLGWVSVQQGWWPLLVLIWFPAAGLLVRLFLIQHDCGHGSFFRNKAVNDWVGRALGVVTLTPYDSWRHAHAIHHAGSGHLDHRGIGDISTLTVDEYQSRPFLGRLLYRLYRHPLTLFVVGPAYQFLLRHRLPASSLRLEWSNWRGPLITNIALIALVGGAIWLAGLGPFLWVQLPITLIAASIGVWLFYVQHQFEETVWARSPQWNRHEAALHGSSHYDLPRILRWFSANIGVHHVHHLCSGIPYYNLQRVLRDHPVLRDVSRLTLLESAGCVRLVLWDEAAHRLVSFKELRVR
ncbi:MAG: fatty acid desaturase [Pseudomonadota bacterium]